MSSRVGKPSIICANVRSAKSVGMMPPRVRLKALRCSVCRLATETLTVCSVIDILDMAEDTSCTATATCLGSNRLLMESE
jgi:hypothetical protein